MSKRGENIYKRKDGRWEARYVKDILPDGSKKYASVYAKSYKEVKEKRTTALSRIHIPSTKITQIICISELMQKWLERNKNNIKISTYIKYEAIVNNHIIPLLGKLPVAKITSDILQNFSNALLKKSLSKSTINDILLVLNMGLSFAESEYSYTCVKAEFFSLQRNEMCVLSNTEQKTLVNYVVVKNDVFSFGILLALFTGIRIGELCALQWEDINDRVIKINKTMQRIDKQIQILPPKSQSSVRIIPIPKSLDFLIENKRKLKGYVLERENGRFTEPRLLQMKFKKYTEECELYNVNFHALRHTFATRCVEAGFDIKTLSEILGHSDVKTTLNKYVHSSMEQKIINMDKLQIEIAI